MDWKEFVSVFLEQFLLELVSYLVPVVWGFVVAFVAKWVQKLPYVQQRYLQIAVETAVFAAEQVGYEDKLMAVTNSITEKLAKAGFDIDLRVIREAIEAEVHKMNQE